MGWQVADHLLADGEGHGNVEAEQEQHEDQVLKGFDEEKGRKHHEHEPIGEDEVLEADVGGLLHVIAVVQHQISQLEQAEQHQQADPDNYKLFFLHLVII